MVDTGNLDFSDNVFSILERLVCYDSAARLNSEEVLEDKYFVEEPIPVLTLKLRVPSPKKTVFQMTGRNGRIWKQILTWKTLIRSLK